MIYLHKILPLFVMPIMLIIYLLTYALWKRKRWPIYTAIACIYVFSTPLFVNRFFKWVEGTEPRLLPKDVPDADAIVVLSGMINQVNSNYGFYPEWGDPDRFFGGIELYKAGKAPKIIFTRGKLPWEKYNYTEGDILRGYAINLDVPDSSILLTNNVENTEDEANSIKSLNFGGNRIILVTSAYHIKRSKMLFEHAGYIVQIYPVDFKSDAILTERLMDFFPDYKSFNLFNIGFRESLGYYFYKYKFFTPLFSPHSR